MACFPPRNWGREELWVLSIGIMQVTPKEGYELFKLGRWSAQKQMGLNCLLLAKAGNERMSPAWEQRGSGTAFRQRQMPSWHEDGVWGGWERALSKGGKTWGFTNLIPTLSSSVWVAGNPLMSLTADSVYSVLYQCLSHSQQKKAKPGNGNLTPRRNAAVPSLASCEGQICLRVSADYSSAIFHSSLGTRAK